MATGAEFRTRALDIRHTPYLLLSMGLARVAFCPIWLYVQTLKASKGIKQPDFGNASKRFYSSDELI